MTQPSGQLVPTRTVLVHQNNSLQVKYLQSLYSLTLSTHVVAWGQIGGAQTASERYSLSRLMSGLKDAALTALSRVLALGEALCRGHDAADLSNRVRSGSGLLAQS